MLTDMRPIIVALLAVAFALIASITRAGDDKGPIVNGLQLQAAEKGTTIERFGSGALVKRPFSADANPYHRFGRGVIIKQPGKATAVCTPFGSTVRCRQAQ